MASLKDFAGSRTELSAREIEHLQRLLTEWQLLADLSFSDLLLYAPVPGRDAFLIVGQVRPYPAQTLYQEDMIGAALDAKDRPKLATALAERRIVREGDPEWREGVPIREEAIPVVLGDRAIAVVGAEQNLATARTPSRLEQNYLEASGDLAVMIAEGTFPFPGEEEERDISPRVGDGFLRLEADLTIRYASPNAVSAYRRLGVTANLVGERLDALGIDERLVVRRLRRGRPVETEIESGGAYVLRRFIPLLRSGEVAGAIAVVLDVTELRQRDRMLLVKDATIREIHHRVKNNLQTVAALLRLQARRLATPEARDALEQSVRRIASIALVHETLSSDSRERAEFDRVAGRLLEMAREGLVSPERRIRFTLEGFAGELPGAIATPLALVVAELLQNAVQHAFGPDGGTVTVSMEREEAQLRVTVADDGCGLPPGFSLEDGANLGLQIVGTLVQSELGGEIVLEDVEGTRIELRIPLPIEE